MSVLRILPGIKLRLAPITLFPTGCESGTPLSFSGYGSRLTIPFFDPVEFDGFRKRTGRNNHTLTPKHGLERHLPISKAEYSVAPTPTKTSPARSPLGYRLNSSRI